MPPLASQGPPPSRDVSPGSNLLNISNVLNGLNDWNAGAKVDQKTASEPTKDHGKKHLTRKAENGVIRKIDDSKGLFKASESMRVTMMQ
jgi:hypothetical protein